MSGWCYNMNSKSLVVIADQWLMRHYYYTNNQAKGIVLCLEATLRTTSPLADKTITLCQLLFFTT